jgi:hypothetical protein
MRLDALLLGIALAGLLGWLFWRDQRRASAWRSRLLDPAAPLIDGCQRRLDALGFPVLRGRFAGHEVEAGLIADTVAVRRLPSLWLAVTLKTPLPGLCTIDVLARARNTEFYSPAEDLPQRLTPPPDWPQHVQIKSDAAGADLDLITREAVEFFAQPHAKELLVTPRGVRLVYQLDQGRRGDYLMLRAARFDTNGVQPELARQLMARAATLHASVSRASAPLKHAA